jgi:hypothetical protein
MIKAILQCYNAKADINGNRYWAFRWINTRTGREVVGTDCGGESNVSAIVRAMGLDWSTCRYERREMGIREFNRMTKGWAYAGCCPDALAAYIKRELRRKP